MWSQQLKMTLDLKAKTDSCRTRDLWVTHFVPLQNINKVALAFTSKDIGEATQFTKNCHLKKMRFFVLDL